jgi:steroid delta-isomerase-like uncharacterized protein
MTKDELAAQARQAIESWNAHDAEKVGSFFSNLAIVRDSADPDNAAKGRDAIVARAQMILDGFSDAKLEILSMSIDGSRVCTEWRFSGTHDGVFLGVPASAQRVVNLGAGVQEFDENGKIISENSYWDATVFLRAAGALPASLATATGS